MIDQAGYLMCPKGDKRCGDQCYNPEKYVCLPPDEDSTNTGKIQS